MIRHLAKLGLALLILAAVTGAEGASCGVTSNRPILERNCPVKDRRDVTITAHSPGPYTILVIADRDGGVDRYGPEHVAGGPYEQTLCYSSGQRIDISMSVRANASDPLKCKIVDGDNVAENAGRSDIVCQLTTSR